MTYVVMTKDVIEGLIDEVEDVLAWTELPPPRKKLNGILTSLRSLLDVADADWNETRT